MRMREARVKQQRAVDALQDPLGAEERTFMKKLPALLRRYEGRFVALYRGRVMGHGSDDEELGRRMYEKLGEVPFYIAKVERAVSVCELPSPELPR